MTKQVSIFFSFSSYRPVSRRLTAARIMAAIQSVRVASAGEPNWTDVLGLAAWYCLGAIQRWLDTG